MAFWLSVLSRVNNIINSWCYALMWLFHKESFKVSVKGLSFTTYMHIVKMPVYTHIGCASTENYIEESSLSAHQRPSA